MEAAPKKVTVENIIDMVVHFVFDKEPRKVCKKNTMIITKKREETRIIFEGLDILISIKKGFVFFTVKNDKEIGIDFDLYSALFSAKVDEHTAQKVEEGNAMHLEFREYFRNGKATYFEIKICKGIYKKNTSSYNVKPKKHTVRRDSTFKVGDLIDLVMNDKVFVCVRCFGVQNIFIQNLFEYKSIIIDDYILSEKEIETFIENDGFDSATDFWEYFGQEDFRGVLIHWTNLKY